MRDRERPAYLDCPTARMRFCMTEVWFRNPDGYIREMVEVGVSQVAWDRGLLVKKKIDPDKHALLYFGTAFDYKVLCVGDQGSALLTPGHTLNKPAAVFPTWCYGDEGSVLEELIENPVGMDRQICNDLDLPADERPVYGQEHRVVITDIPPGTSGPGRKFIRYLKELQEDHPECIIHVHGFYSWRLAFGQGFASADVQPRDAAAKGKIHLPSGKEERFEQAQAHPHWVTQLGFKPTDLEIPRNRCMYNIKSAVWAGENYEKIFKPMTRSRKGAGVDFESPSDEFTPPQAKSHMVGPVKKGDGDQFVCNECSLQNKCTYYREGAVCSVPGAEPVRLAKMFGSRDADTIIDGLGVLMSRNTTRLEGALELEEIDGELDPETTKLVGQVFDQAVKLVRLVDPSRFKQGGVQVNVAGSAQVAVANPKQMVAAAVRALEQQGIPRAQQTPEMIQGILIQEPTAQQRAIEGTVTHSRMEQKD